MHRIAPQPSLPEFYVESGYLLDFIIAWKLMLSGQAIEGHRAIDFLFLAQWLRHRETLTAVCRMQFDPRRVKAIVCACLDFMDALVKDWYAKLMDKEPETPLDITRLEALQEHQRRLNAIPGEKWEIKY